MNIHHFRIIFLENPGISRGIRARIADQLSLMALAGSFAAGCLSNAGEAGIITILPLKNINHSAKWMWVKMENNYPLVI